MKLKFLIIYLLIATTCSFAQKRDLDYFINQAVANSPLLDSYRSQVLAAKIDSQILLATTRLLVAANSNSFIAPEKNGYGYDRAITNGGQLQGIITASKNIIPKSTLRAQFLGLHYQIDSLFAASKISEQDIKKAIIAQYITTYGDQLQLEFNNELHDMLFKEDEILKKLTQKNVYRQVDYLSFLITYQQQSLNWQQLQAQYKNDYATLNYLAGIFDTSTVKIEEPQFNVFNKVNFDSSVFTLKFKIDSLRLINERTLINIGYRPKFNLYADGGFLSSFTYEGYKNFGASVGINFTMPIYDGKQRKLQQNKITLAEQARVRARDFYNVQYRQQIAQLQQQLTAIEGLLLPINTQIEYIHTLIDADLKLMQTGDLKVTDLALAITNYITTQNLLVQNKISRFQIINQINYWNR